MGHGRYWLDEDDDGDNEDGSDSDDIVGDGGLKPTKDLRWCLAGAP